MESGACFDPTSVWWVNQDATPGGDGSMSSPFVMLADAMGLIGNGDEGVIRLVGTTADYSENVTVLSGRTVAIVGTGQPVIEGVGLNAVDVATGGVLFLDGVELSGAGRHGVSCDGGSVWIDGSDIHSNTRSGVVTSFGCTANIRNSFIARNADGVSAAGVDVDGGTLEVLYSTIVQNRGTSAGDAIECTGGTTATLRNSIVLSGGVGPGPGMVCPGITVENTAVDDMAFGGGTNSNVGPFMLSWFVGGTDYHINAGPPFEGIAQWVLGDPLTDFDGDARPTVMTGYPGADEPS